MVGWFSRVNVVALVALVIPSSAPFLAGCGSGTLSGGGADATGSGGASGIQADPTSGSGRRPAGEVCATNSDCAFTVCGLQPCGDPYCALGADAVRRCRSRDHLR